jgi:hypothetical protein
LTGKTAIGGEARQQLEIALLLWQVSLCLYSFMKQAANECEIVVQRQLEAYNGRDIETLLSLYAEDAQLFEHPAKLVASGWAELRERFSARFQEPDLKAELLQRTVMGNIVVDHERVTRNFPDGKGTIEMIMIYDVQEGRIANAWVIVGPRAKQG